MISEGSILKKDYFLLVFFSVFALAAIGQDQFGMANSNFSPTVTMLHNPSSVVDSDVMIDLHLGGGAAFAHSNYAYLAKEDFSFWQNVVMTQEIPAAQFNFSRDEYSLYSSGDYQSLSGTYQYKSHGFGISTRIRSFADVRNVPEVFANSIQVPQIKGQGDINPGIVGKDLNASNVHIAILSYGELGLTYANAIKHRDRNLFIVGGSIKHLWGLTGGGVKIDNMDYRLDSSGIFSYENLTAQTSLSNQLFGGRGWSFDLGFTYKKMLDNVTNYNPFRREAGCRIYDYKMKVAMSIIDVGYVRFKKSNTNSYVSNVSGNIDDFSNLSISAEPSKFLGDALNVPDSVMRNDTDKFTVIVPAAFVFQYDYNLEKNNLFMSVQYVHGLTPSSTFGIQRPSVLALTPRYETRRFEFALSFGMYNLQEVRSGVMVRWGPITIGTDKLGTVLGISDVTGFDVYGHLAFKIIHQKRCGRIRFW